MIDYFFKFIPYVDFFISWFPWINFISDSFFLQAITIYTFYLIIITINVYYLLFYTFLQILLFGFFLSLYQVEVFAAFLWLTEVVVLLVFLFVLFNTNPSGNIDNNLNKKYELKNASIFLIVFLLNLNFTYFMLPEYMLSNFLITFSHWDDYYEAINNVNMNDLYGIFISFYIINSFEMLIIGFVLLFGSMLAVILNKFLKTNKTLSYLTFFDIFDYFKNIKEVLFLRKQNLTNQENSKESTRSFKKKNK